MFWALLVPLAAFSVFMFSLIRELNAKAILLLVPLGIAPILLLLALASPERFAWAGRVVSGMVFLGYVVYAINSWFFSSVPFRLFERRSEASPRNALLGLLIIGVPAFMYAVFGRFTLRPEAEDPPESDEERPLDGA